MKMWHILRKRMKKYENRPSFQTETKKSMKIWQNLTRRLKKYDNLSNFNK